MIRPDLSPSAIAALLPAARRARRLRLLVPLVSALALQGCLTEASSDHQLPGYIEADVTSVASPVSGTMTKLDVREGQQVKQGEALYVLESSREQAQLLEAQARKEQAEAQKNNLSKGARTAELDTYRAKLRYAKAQLAQAETNLKKSESLFKKGFISEAQVDSDRTARSLAEASVEEARAALKVAKEGARQDEQTAAAAQATAMQASVKQVEWLLQQKQVSSAVDGVVQEVFVRQGEYATAGSTVMTILHTGTLRVRFFVPNELRPQFLPGTQVPVVVSGCSQPLTARVSRVSARPEYTQPLMFSYELRDRLSFLTEARLDNIGNCSVPPGTPVGVRLAAKR